MKHLLPLAVALLPALSATLRAQENGVMPDSAIATVWDPAVVDTLAPAEFAWMAGDGLDQDTVVARTQHFDAAAIRLLRADPDLDYDRTLHVENLWRDRFLNWLSKLLEDIFGTGAGRWVFGHLYWGILAFAIGLLLYYFRKRLFHGGVRADAAHARQVTEMEEDIEHLDLDGSITDAERDGNWRLAVRYHYLKVLRHLVDEGLIRWEPRHTDRDYLRQLQGPALRSAFGEISFLFKWAWYGDAPMDEARYRQLVPIFEGFNAKAPQLP